MEPLGRARSEEQTARRRRRQSWVTKAVAVLVAPIVVTPIAIAVLMGFAPARLVHFAGPEVVWLLTYGIPVNVVAYGVAIWVLGGDDPAKREDPSSTGVIAWVSAASATLGWLILAAMAMALSGT